MSNTERKLAWSAIDVATLNPDCQKAHKAMKASSAKAREDKEAFEELVRKHHEKGFREAASKAVANGVIDLKNEVCDPVEGDMIFGYNFGRDSIAFPEKKAKTGKGQRKLTL